MCRMDYFCSNMDESLHRFHDMHGDGEKVRLRAAARTVWREVAVSSERESGTKKREHESFWGRVFKILAKLDGPITHSDHYPVLLLGRHFSVEVGCM